MFIDSFIFSFSIRNFWNSYFILLIKQKKPEDNFIFDLSQSIFFGNLLFMNIMLDYKKYFFNYV